MKDNRYSDELLDYASKLDAITNGLGKISKYASEIVAEQDEIATKKMMMKMAKITTEERNKQEIIKVAELLKASLINYYGYLQIAKICDNAHQRDDPRTLPELLAELNAMIGLEKVKQQVNALISYQEVQKMRESYGFKIAKNTLHLAFLGKPGTGKTTVARTIGHIYKQLGLLSKGHFLEVSRTDLIAGYQGQTALKVKKVIEKARGGVLFIDEAYSITENDHSDSYGRECLTELTKALEDYRSDLVVIVAGYTDPMNKFLESNPGLRSRFNTFIEFDDYNANELEEMFIRMCEKDDYKLHESGKERIRKILANVISKKDQSFANGRFLRNLYDDAVINHAKRVVTMQLPSRELLSIIIDDDFSR